MAYYSVYTHSDINTLRIGKIVTVEINLSVSKLMYLVQFVSDLSKRGLKILKSKLKCCLLKSKESLITGLKAFVLWLKKCFIFLGDSRYIYPYEGFSHC